MDKKYVIKMVMAKASSYNKIIHIGDEEADKLINLALTSPFAIDLVTSVFAQLGHIEYTKSVLIIAQAFELDPGHLVQYFIPLVTIRKKEDEPS